MKRIILILLVTLLMTGCTVTRIDNYNYEEVLNKVLSMNIKTYNLVGNGYKYYAPYGVKRISSLDYNDILEKDNNKYYLFVDVVGYFYKNGEEYKENSKSFYSNKLKINNKEGYVQIDEKDNGYYIKMYYNYAKIEVQVKKDNLNDALINCCYILNSIKYNDSLLKKEYESGNMESKEETYKLFDNKEKDGDFSKYFEQYDKYEENKDKEDLSDDSIIEHDTTNEYKKSTKSKDGAN